MFRLGILVSGGGTNLQAIIDRIEDGTLEGIQIATIVSNSENAYALERARKHNIDNIYIDPKKYNSKEEYESELIKHFKSFNVDLIVLAGFVKILTNNFIKEYENKIINIHPALVPSFCGKGYYGLKIHEEALKRGVKITGATVHFVTEGADEGPIIIQKAVEVKEGDTPEDLQKRVMEEAEWVIYPEAIRLIAYKKIYIDSQKVVRKR